VGTAERVLLRHTGNGKRLAWETGQQHVVIRNILCAHLRDIAVDGVSVTVVFGVSLLRVGIPFAGEDTVSADGFKGRSDAADAGEKIDETEVRFALQRNFKRQQLLQCRHKIDRWLDFAEFPTPQMPHADT
jgi:hypothetical protein